MTGNGLIQLDGQKEYESQIDGINQAQHSIPLTFEPKLNEDNIKCSNEKAKSPIYSKNGKITLTTDVMDDSGIALLNRSKDKNSQRLANCNLVKSIHSLESSETIDYQSPLLIEDQETMAEDAYDVIQVRDEVNRLNGEIEKNSVKSNESSSEEMNDEDETLSDDSLEVQIDSSPKSEPLLIQSTLKSTLLKNSNGILESSSDELNDTHPCPTFKDQKADLIAKDEESCGSGFNKVPDEKKPIFDAIQKGSRGKKRAQSETRGQNDEVIIEENDSHYNNMQPLRFRRLAEKKLYYPVWLNEQFKVRSDDWTPKPSRQILELLCTAIQELPADLEQLRRLFEKVFGPIICHNQDSAIIQSAQSVYTLFGGPNVRLIKSGMILGPATNKILQEDKFIFNYLSSFSTAFSFFEHDSRMQNSIPMFIVDEMHERMANWYGHHSDTGYEYWAHARSLYLNETVKYRPMEPEDLSIEERQEWIRRLERCLTFDEAISVTEDVFGPLHSPTDLPCPQIDIEKFWNPCQCNICLRSRKRIKLDKE